ncbi:MAG: hypothetical protein KDA36_04240 [Planctomycetaceae bacterium]|nr:hypothetical protein [Planctomycetaceae bacterium]
MNRTRSAGFWASWGFPVAWLVALCIVVPSEVARWNQLPPEMRNLASWFFVMNPDTSLAGFFLLFAPLFWLIRGGIQIGRSDPLTSLLAWGGRGISSGEAPKVTWKLRFCGIGFVLLSIFINFGVGRDLQQLPPAYHDEYSYLFQAKTYLDGKISYPVHPAGEVFDQIHVLNQGRFTSRYFPGTGMWLAPFVALGDPHLGHVIAGGLITWWIFWTGFEVGGASVAIIAGLLTACSPGMAIFGNLLLAHHPGLAGLSLFLYRFLRWMRTQNMANLWLAGFGLSYAMLCRPMTAAGFALPFGVFFASWLFRRFQSDRKRFFSGLLALGSPLLVGFAVLAYWNLHTTGNWRMTAYQAYNDYYTPRHVYGFNNVVRGEKALGDRLLPIATRNYDTWAENLTPKLAAINVYQRWVASWRWTLGIIPLLLVTLSAIPFLTKSSVKWRLIALSILSLHVVHIPYWFDGIMHWHYVFETVVLWPLLFAGGTAVLFDHWRKESRPWMGLWWIGLVGVILTTSFIPLEPYWGSRVAGAKSELLFAKVRYARFRQILQQQIRSRPALVLIEHDPADRSLDYVNNDPRLQSEILLGRFDPQKSDFNKLRELFPQQTLYLYHVKQNQLELVR